VLNSVLDIISKLFDCLTCMTKNTTGHVKEWHDVHNDECPNNGDSQCDCKCKRIVNRKPYRKIKVRDENVPRGYRHDMIVEVWPHGLITLRERGRRRSSSHSIMAGDLYAMLLRWKALAHVAAKKKARAERRRLRKGKR